MSNRKVTVVGAGNVGATAAQRIVEKQLADVVEFVPPPKVAIVVVIEAPEPVCIVILLDVTPAVEPDIAKPASPTPVIN